MQLEIINPDTDNEYISVELSDAEIVSIDTAADEAWIWYQPI